MENNKFIVLKGDGIGPEIMESALKILNKAQEKYNYQYSYKEHLFGGASIDKYFIPFNEELKNDIKNYKAILLASVGGPKWNNCKKRPEDGLLEIRKYLDVFSNVRPLKVDESLVHLSPLKEQIISGTDLVIVRELTSGIYFGKNRELKDSEAYDTMSYKKEEIERIVRYAFDLARKRRKKLTSVDKANVLASSKLWRSVVDEIHKEYNDIEVEHLYVDAAAMLLITKPRSFDVIVTENLFGDILSDEASVLAGSLGLLSSSSFGNNIALYEPAHGSAPDIQGQNIAYPCAMIFSMCSMLKYSFNNFELADKIESAVYKTLKSGILTKDLNSNKYVLTSDFTDAVILNL